MMECPAGWGGYPGDPCPDNESTISQSTDLVMHVAAHSCVRIDEHADNEHLCTCGSKP
jgi:hypothetical protein